MELVVEQLQDKELVLVLEVPLEEMVVVLAPQAKELVQDQLM
jgi:hypothetical protein